MPEVSVDQKRAFWQRCKTDFHYFAEKCLRIRALVDKNREPVRVSNDSDPEGVHWDFIPLRLNNVQRHVVNIIQTQERMLRPERLWILKSRKEGCSTAIQALAYWRAAFRPGYEVLTYAHLAASTAKIAQISQYYNQNLPSVVAPRVAGEPFKGGIIWSNGSMMECKTARSDDSGRSGTPSMAHLSEVALYESNRDETSSETMLQGTLAAFDDVAGNCVIGETTSKGSGGPFYKRFNEAQDSFEFLRNPSTSRAWAKVFFSWIDSEKYAFKVSELDARADAEMRAAYNSGDASRARLIAKNLGYDELWFLRAMDAGLTPPQVRWAMDQVRSKFSGDVVRFDREYPITWHVAFSAASRTVFPTTLIAKWRNLHQMPEQTVVARALVEKENRQIEMDYGGDRWYFFELPIDGHEYVIGADIAIGTERDNSSACIFDRHTLRQVAEYACNVIPPDEFGEQLALAGRMYNNALVVPEANDGGKTTIRRMLDLGYSRLYRRNPGRNVRPGTNWAREFGFQTTAATRAPLVAEFVRDLKEERNPWEMMSPRFAAETETFIYDRNDRPDHMDDHHDDCIIAACLAAEGHRYLPAPNPLEVVEKGPDSWLSKGRRLARMFSLRRTPNGLINSEVN